MTLTFLGATGTGTGSNYLAPQGGANLPTGCSFFLSCKQPCLRKWLRRALAYGQSAHRYLICVVEA